MVKAKIKTIANILLIVLFCIFLCSSALVMISSDKSVSSDDEKRRLATLPPIPQSVGQLRGFFKGLDDYFNDHFGFREHYIHRYHRELQKRFNISAVHERVIQGLDGWFFYNRFNQLEDFFGMNPLPGSLLDAWFADLRQRQKWVESQGIYYLYMPIPNKQSIYPEQVMDGGKIKKGTSRFEQFLEKIDYMLPEFMVDLFSLLDPEQHERRLYYKTDTHWTQYGGYLAYLELMQKIKKRFPNQEFRTEFEFVDGVEVQGGDLARLSLQPALTEIIPQMKKFKRCHKPNTYLPYNLSDTENRDGRNSFVRTCPEKRLTALVFRDSFFRSVEPYFSENFKEVVYLYKYYDQRNVEEMIAYYKPDIIVDTIVERHIFDSFLGSGASGKERGK
jgi:hypothetical protein